MFTPQEKLIVDQLKGQGKTPQQIAGYIGGIRTNSPSTIAKEIGETPKPVDDNVLGRVLSDIPSDIVETGKRAFGATNEAGKGIVETFNDPNLGVLDKTVKIGSQAFKGIGRFLGETFLGAAKLGTTEQFEESAAGAMGEVATKVMESDTVKGTIDWYKSQSPEKKRAIDNVLGYAEGLLEITGAGAGTRALKTGARSTVQTGQRAFNEVMQEVAVAAKRGKTSAPIRLANERLDEATRVKAVDDLTRVYKDSLIENRKAINDNLDELARGNSFGDKKVTRDDLIKNLAEEGYVPDVEGRLARFQNVFDDISERQSRVMKALEPILANSKATIKTKDLFKSINSDLVSNPQISGGLTRSQAELGRLFESYKQKFGDTLTATQVNEIRKESNALTKAFKDSDKFSADTASQIGRSTRTWLDENIPDEAARKANAEWARLNTIRETADILDNQQIDVGIWGRALGSYVTTVAGAGVGLATGGPAGLVAISILTKMGGDKIADMLRQRAFNPSVTAQIRTIMRKDDELVKQLLQTAEKQNQDIIKDFLLPAAGESGYRSEIKASKPIQVGKETQSTIDAREAANPNIKTTAKGYQSQGKIEIQGVDSEGNITIMDNGNVLVIPKEDLPVIEAGSKVPKKKDNTILGKSPEEIAKLAGTGVAGYMLLDYVSEDGSLLPEGIAVLGSLNPGVRRTVLRQVEKAAGREIKDTIKLYRAGKLEDTRGTGIFLSSKKDVADSYQTTGTGNKITQEYSIEGANLKPAENRWKLIKEIDPKWDKDKVYDKFLAEQRKNGGKLVGGVTAEQRLQAEAEKRIKNILSKEGFDGVEYSGGVTDQSGEYQIFDSKIIKESEVDTSYRGGETSHNAPDFEGGAPIYDLTLNDMYPDDIYSSNGLRFYGSGYPEMDKKAFSIINKTKGKPDAEITIYRAVPKDVKDINPGDWIAITKEYAQQHGESNLNNDFKILEKKVKAKDIFTEANSIQEFGYSPK